MPWSRDHLEVIATLQSVILDGGQFCLAMPRGNGKTSLVVASLIWAIVYGHRLFLVAIAASSSKAKAILEAIKGQIETNERLAANYPSAVVPIRKLEGINNRTAGQTCLGDRTRISWTGERLIFPTISGAASSGVILQIAGLLGSIRGLQATRADGRTVRPDYCVLDDPQTDESAARPAQTQRRLDVISKAVLGLAGPDQKIAVVCPCTVIQPDDLAYQLLDRERSPEWRGRKSKLLETMPDDLKLWDKYAEIRKESLREFENISQATAFYEANRAAMDAGAVASWPARFESDHISAVQYAMDKWSKNQEAFFAEYQNEPRPLDQPGVETLRAVELLDRCDGSKRGEVPEWSETLTAFADVQQDIFPFMVVAWSQDMRGRIIDYGGWPRQNKKYYTLRDVAPTLREWTGAATVEAALEIGLDQLAGDLKRKYGDRLAWFGVDANWQLSTSIVYSAARRHEKLTPFHGRFVGAASLPMANWKRKPGERPGHFWRSAIEQHQRVVTVDINAWKTLVAKRLRGGGGITWFGNRPYDHEMLCDQLAAEYAVRVSGRGRRCDEWKNRPGRDNHLWDCLIGCAVGASMAGVEVAGQERQQPRKKLNAAEIAAIRAGRRNG